MSCLGKRYELKVNIEITEGCFTSIDDLMEYIRYRLNLRSRGSDSVKLNSVTVVSETVLKDQMEMDYEVSNVSSV